MKILLDSIQINNLCPQTVSIAFTVLYILMPNNFGRKLTIFPVIKEILTQHGLKDSVKNPGLKRNT